MKQTGPYFYIKPKEILLTKNSTYQ